MRDLARLVTSLGSDDWRRIEQAVDALGDRLATLPPRDLARVSKKLEQLARHSKWEVRRAVARAFLHSRDEVAPGVLSLLAEDQNSWVRDAARRTLARRVELSNTDLLQEQHEELLERWLDDYEARPGARGRQAVRKVASKYAELVIREAYHELVKAIAPLDLSLTNLGIALNEDRIERARCKKHVKRARDRLRLLKAMLDSLRDLATEVAPEHHVEDLRELLDEAVALVRDRRRGKIDCELVVAKGLSVELHRVRLLQAFTNILQNAIESYDGVERRPWLRIEAVVEGPRVVVGFADRGCGMSEEALRDVFNLFASKKPQGLGFGLPLARKIIETEHGGAIGLSSVAGEGTTVTITLPREQGS